jgi:hypothetical protein
MTMARRSIDSSAFRHHVDRHLEPLRADLSAKRSAAWKQLVFRVTLSVVLIASIVGSGWLTPQPEDDLYWWYWWMFVVMVAVFGTLFCIWCALPWSRHGFRLKHDVLTRLVPFFGDFSYRPKGTMSPSEFADSGLLPVHNDHWVEDEVTGSHRGVALRAADVELLYKRTIRMRRGGTRRVVEDVFDGVLLALELPKPAACGVLLGTADCFRGRFAIDDDVWHRVDLPHDGLEAWTRDPAVCTSVLDAKLLDRAAALVSGGHVRRLRMAWHGKTLVMLVDFGENFFEMPFRGEIDFRHFGEIVERQLACLTRVIDQLDIPATGASANSSPRSLQQRMRQDTHLAPDFEANQSRNLGCLPMIVFTPVGFCAYLWLLADAVHPLVALGLAFTFGSLSGFGLGQAVFGKISRWRGVVAILIGLLGITPALPNETLDQLPGGQLVKALKQDASLHD